MIFFILPFILAGDVIGENDAGYIAQCIKSGFILPITD